MSNLWAWEYGVIYNFLSYTHSAFVITDYSELKNNFFFYIKKLGLLYSNENLFPLNQVTWADFYWEICSTTLLVFKSDLLDIHPRLVTLRKKVQSIPAIADWILRRPQTKLQVMPAASNLYSSSQHHSHQIRSYINMLHNVHTPSPQLHQHFHFCHILLIKRKKRRKGD